MDAHKYTAVINWISAEGGGRNKLPTDQYSTAALFEGHEEYWSLVIKVHNQTEIEKMNRIQWADVWFLMPDAPHDWLKTGAKFTLFEVRAVAHGECIHKTI